MQLANAIAWGHMQLKGGWRNVFITSAVYLLIVGGLILVTLRLNPSASAMAMASWTNGLLGLQIGILLLFGCWTIAGAVRKDVASKMIESHRLMPVTGTDAVAAYITGPACQVIALFVVNLLLGLALAQGSGTISPVAWLKANFVLGVFALCYWIVVVFLTLTMPVGSRVLMGMAWVVVVGYQTVLPLTPGLCILFGPAMGESVFGILSTNRLQPGQAISMIAEVLVGALCYAGAARRYRRDDVLAWGPIMGLVVLATYVVLSVTGLSLWETLGPRMIRIGSMAFEVQLLIAAAGGLLVGLIPVSAAAWLRTLHDRRRALHDPAPNPRPVAMALVAMTAAMIASVLLPLAVYARWHVATRLIAQTGNLFVSRPDIGPFVPVATIIRTILVTAAFLLSVGYLLLMMYRAKPRSGLVAVLFIVLTWSVPLAADFIISGLNGFTSDSPLSSLSGCSPPVALAYIWTSIGSAGGAAAEPSINANPGIAVQVLIAAALAAAYYRTKRTAAKSQ